jgi:hypothetical protein
MSRLDVLDEWSACTAIFPVLQEPLLAELLVTSLKTRLHFKKMRLNLEKVRPIFEERDRSWKK